ncbi:hypothetical protein HPB47_027941 [Ixodes persulcatus]|uniref:Uncharacterized protein n=1 Tax=Ixodes persulcatus TaxID=34615 RepID=A0AC60PW96_IXOPE|nr:hypothetical protein HPB47_027941 [Ixodes persulcatus]
MTSEGQITAGATIFTTSPEQAEEAAIALALTTTPRPRTIISDSKTTILNYAKGYVSTPAQAILRTLKAQPLQPARNRVPVTLTRVSLSRDHSCEEEQEKEGHHSDTPTMLMVTLYADFSREKRCSNQREMAPPLSLGCRAGPLHCPRTHHPGGGDTAPDRRDPFGPRQFSDFSRHYVSLPFNPPYLPSSGTCLLPRREYHVATATNTLLPERWEAALRSSDPATQLKVVRRAAEVAEAHGLSAIKRA